ncbi:hypothetical protein EE612_038537 [Oryza sativa]|nr:hypothetical protein EE612_038537 [Oryza sativa]
MVWGGSVVTIGHKVSPEHVSAADGMDGDEVGQDVDILYRRRLASFHGGGLRWTGSMVQEGNERPCCLVRGWGGDEVDAVRGVPALQDRLGRRINLPGSACP